MPEQATVNTLTQIGPEATPGTLVPATRQLVGLYLADEPKIDTFQFIPQGHLYPSESVQGKEWSEHKIVADFPDFDGLVYPLSSLLGTAAITTPTNAILGRQWLWNASLINGALGQTYTLERGSVAGQARRYGYVTADALTLTAVKDKVTVDGHAWGQVINTGFTLTPALPQVAAIPLPGTGCNIYLDITSANIGVTQLVRVGSCSLAFANYYTPFYGVDRSKTSYSVLVPARPTITAKMKVAADANGMALYAYIKSGQTVYCRFDFLGPFVDDVYNLSLGSPSAGTFTLSFNGQTTAGIAFNATGATAQTAFTLLSTVGAGNATITGAAGGPYVIEMIGGLKYTLLPVTGSGAGLTGGTFTGPTAVQVSYDATFDMALKMSAPAAFGDEQALEAIEFTGMVCEDPNWSTGQAIKATIINQIAAL